MSREYGKWFPLWAFVAAWVSAVLLALSELVVADFTAACVPLLLMVWWGAERRRAEAERVTRLVLDDANRRRQAVREVRQLVDEFVRFEEKDAS